MTPRPTIPISAPAGPAPQAPEQRLVGRFKPVDAPAEAPLAPLVGTDGFAAALSISRRTLERLRSAGKLPRPDVIIGRMPRWKPSTIQRWIDDQANARGKGGRS